MAASSLLHANAAHQTDRKHKKWAGDRSSVGIIAGSGDLPAMVIDVCKGRSQPCFVIAFEGETDLRALEDIPHMVIGLDKMGTAIAALRDRYIQDIVLIGRVGRPELAGMRPDFTTLRLLSRIARARRTGDNALFNTIIRFLEDTKFTVRGVQEVVPDIIAKRGVLGKVQPDARAQSDVSFGVEVARNIGAYDIGQAVVVQNGRVLGVEAAEGTDALLERVRALHNPDAPGGVLVKTKKPQQDERIDLPTVGPQTVENAHRAGLRGIAVEAGHAIIIHRQEMIERANALGIFLYGIGQ